jgi:polyhydroxyalkanoate synthesis regulator phasin
VPDLPDQVRSKVSGMVNERTKATRDRAQKAARTLLEQAGLGQVADNATERVTHLLEDILTASRTNRRVLEKLVEDQIDEAATRLGFARQFEVDSLRKEIAELRVQVVPTPARRAAARKATGARKGHTSSSAPAPAKKAAAKKAGATRASKATAAKATTRKTATKKSSSSA